jgi:hypothetical protein
MRAYQSGADHPHRFLVILPIRYRLMFDKGQNPRRINDFNALNTALMRLMPSISGISVDMFMVPGHTYSMLVLRLRAIIWLCMTESNEARF